MPIRLKQASPSRRRHLKRSEIKCIPLLLCLVVALVMLERTWTLSKYSTLQGMLEQVSDAPPRLDSVPQTKPEKTPRLDKHAPPALDKLTAPISNSSACRQDFGFRLDRVTRYSLAGGDRKRKIPRIVHQTAKSRCMHKVLYHLSNRWSIPGWSYHFHDDEAIMQLLTSDFPEFPHLKQVAQNCALSGTVKADLWRYVVLWQYGGVYADIDSAPNLWNKTSIQDTDDGFFVVEQYHILSQYFMAASPRHPIMFYAVQQALMNLMALQDTGSLDAALVTGPHALHAAFTRFRQDTGFTVSPMIPGAKPVWQGIFEGTNNRTIRVEGIGENQNEYVWRDKAGSTRKRRYYAQMGMEHFQTFIANRSKETKTTCLHAILNDANNQEKQRHTNFGV